MASTTAFVGAARTVSQVGKADRRARYARSRLRSFVFWLKIVLMSSSSGSIGSQVGRASDGSIRPTVPAQLGRAGKPYACTSRRWTARTLALSERVSVEGVITFDYTPIAQHESAALPPLPTNVTPKN